MLVSGGMSAPRLSWCPALCLGLLALGCATPGVRPVAPGAPEWVRKPDTCFLTGRIVLDGELRPHKSEDTLAQVECRHLRVRLDTDDGSSRRIEADGNLGSGYGECHYQFADVPPGNSTLAADFDLLPELKGRYLFKSDAPFNAIVCNADSHTWNQTLDLTVMLPEVLGPK